MGDVVDLPNYLGWAADAFVFNSVLGNLHSPRAGLLKAALQLRPGGHVVVSHPLGRAWHTQLAAAQPRVTPHLLPGSRAELEALVQGLPLQVSGVCMGGWSAHAQGVPRHAPLPHASNDSRLPFLPCPALKVVEFRDEPELYLAVLQVRRTGLFRRCAQA